MAALSPKTSTLALSLSQKVWNAMSAWTIKMSGYQKLGRLKKGEGGGGGGVGGR